LCGFENSTITFSDVATANQADKEEVFCVGVAASLPNKDPSLSKSGPAVFASCVERFIVHQIILSQLF
jgi:hypothetical protein